MRLAISRRMANALLPYIEPITRFAAVALFYHFGNQTWQQGKPQKRVREAPHKCFYRVALPPHSLTEPSTAFTDPSSGPLRPIPRV